MRPSVLNNFFFLTFTDQDSRIVFKIPSAKTFDMSLSFQNILLDHVTHGGSCQICQDSGRRVKLDQKNEELQNTFLHLIQTDKWCFYTSIVWNLTDLSYLSNLGSSSGSRDTRQTRHN